ncbi:MAG: hypothetical protein LBS71_01250 [Puniceicoccales bacterium]|jgi:hypothetical protein|nr:hypothetical protein [Puniceicoccales bacterium]
MDEFQRLAEQNQPIKLKVPAPDGNSVFVKLAPPLLFDFPVNLQQYSSTLNTLLVDSNVLKEQNTNSMRHLLGNSKNIVRSNFDSQNINIKNEQGIFKKNSIVGKFLKLKTVSDEDKKVVVQLAHQIADIWQSGKYATDGSEPYAMPARIALLSYKLGLSTTFNCKSGKDRTGVANIEINNLAAEIEMSGGIVPEPYHALDDREMLNNNKMVNDSGANHVTEACTGLKGLKIVSKSAGGMITFSGVKNRLGDVTGASSLAKS